MVAMMALRLRVDFKNNLTKSMFARAFDGTLAPLTTDFTIMQIPQHQTNRPGLESQMIGKPVYDDENYRGSSKLAEKVAIITGGDSGIGRSVAVLFAKEGADIAIVYLNEHEDAEETKKHVEAYGRRCVLIPGDIGHEPFSLQAVEQTIAALGKVDILVNNAAEQHPQDDILKITAEQLEKTFRTNIFGMFFMVKATFAAPEGRLDDHQHHVGHGLQGAGRVARLLVDQGGDRRLHPVALAPARRQGDPRQRRRPGADLDPVHPLDLPSA